MRVLYAGAGITALRPGSPARPCLTLPLSPRNQVRIYQPVLLAPEFSIMRSPLQVPPP